MHSMEYDRNDMKIYEYKNEFSLLLYTKSIYIALNRYFAFNARCCSSYAHRSPARSS